MIDKLDIVLPCYNPHAGWEKNVAENYHKIKKKAGSVPVHLYIVNDGSAKGITEKEIEHIKNEVPDFHYISYSGNQGKGYALRTAIAQTTADHIIYTDIDFPYDTDSFFRVYDELISNRSDIIVGTRAEAYYEHVPRIRVIISKFLRWIFRTFLRLKVTDTQCGLKGFNKKGKEIFLKTEIKRYLFDFEFIYMASRQKGIKITPVQVDIRPEIHFTTMNLKILFSESLNLFKVIFRKNVY